MGVLTKIRRLFGIAGFEHHSEHWKSQRSSSVALFLLGYWFISQIFFSLNDAGVAEIQQWMFDHLKPDKRSKMLTELVGC